MVDTASLEARARTSQDGEAYASVTKGPGYRLGIGARSSSGRPPDFFIEIVLDPFPDRPEVNPGRLEEQAALAECLRSRGYSICCDDTGILTCERTMTRTASSREVREVGKLLRSFPRRQRLPAPS